MQENSIYFTCLHFCCTGRWSELVLCCCCSHFTLHCPGLSSPIALLKGFGIHRWVRQFPWKFDISAHVQTVLRYFAKKVRFRFSESWQGAELKHFIFAWILCQWYWVSRRPVIPIMGQMLLELLQRPIKVSPKFFTVSSNPYPVTISKQGQDNQCQTP